jgi:hypothetical protein
MLTRKSIAAAVAAASLLALAGPVAGASANTTLPAGATTLPAGATTLPAGATTLPAGATTLPAAALTFVPPSVGPIRVDLGPTIINGQVINAGLHVLMPGVSAPPISWTMPAFTWPPRG